MKLKEKYKRIQQVLHNYAVSIKLHDCDNGRLIDEFNLLQDTMFDYELCLKKNVEYRTALYEILSYSGDGETNEEIYNIVKKVLEGDEE